MKEIPKKFACEYNFAINGHEIRVMRFDNHGNPIPDGKWVACWVRGGANPWYSNVDGTWKYKCGCRYDTADDAYEHCLQFPPS